ncbi:MAG: N-acetylneuraminate synthase family protein [Candidatus Omnitrophota bacterium]
MKRIKIGKFWIGDGAPCFITVDIGANHNRDYNIAKKLIRKASEAGVDAIKFQFYSAETLYSRKVPKHSYYKKHLWDLIKEIETPQGWIPGLKQYCDKNKIIFFATPFDFSAVDALDPYVDFYKIASFELVDLSLIEYTAKKKKAMIISTGLANTQEIEEAYSACKRVGNNKIIFLQCASSYPASPEIINLRAMKTIKDRFPDTIVGLSDHSRGIHISVAAVAMGARVIEKHFTLSRKLKGPDHSFAIEPDELKELVVQIRDVEKAFGDGRKTGPRPQELENFRIARRSIHAEIDIPKETKITRNMLTIKRPGYGIRPKFLHAIIGRKAKRNIEKDQWITWKMI